MQPGVGGEHRVALRRARAAEAATAIPGELLVQLAATGTWPMPRALAYAGRYDDPASRCSALTWLTPHAPVADRPGIAAEALAA
jgi:hypothetical protein